MNEVNIKTNKFSLVNYLKNYKLMIFFFCLLNIVEIIMSFFIAQQSAEFLNFLTSKKFYLSFQTLIYLLIIHTVRPLNLFIVKNISNYTIQKICSKMNVDIMSRCFSISSKAFSDHNLGNFTTRVQRDPQIIILSFFNIVDRLTMLISDLVILIYIIYLNVYLGLILILITIISSILFIIRNKIYEHNIKLINNIKEKNDSLIIESIKGERDVKSLYMEKSQKQQLSNNFELYDKITIKSNLRLNIIVYLRPIIINVITILSLMLGVYFVEKGFFAISSFLFYNQNYSKVNNLSSILSDINSYFIDIKISTKRIQELYDNYEYELESFGTYHLKDVKGNIKFKNVKFAYKTYKEIPIEEQIKMEKYNKKHKIKDNVPTRELIGTNKVFNNLNFEIEQNSTVALVGKSGCGKTTIANLISKIYTADKGKILIDDVDINKLDKDTIRNSITIVNQNPYIFDMTIKENLLLANPKATDEEINKSIKDCALDEFISTLPEGIDTHVGEGGIKLSGGQKQRLAIARALLKKSSIIIFDESTSSLDNIAQKTIKESIDNIKGQATVVIIAHRLSTIKNVDKIFYLEKGEIIDTGTFEELFEHNQKFKSMFLAENI